jgi:hypothetical protein
MGKEIAELIWESYTWAHHPRPTLSESGGCCNPKLRQPLNGKGSRRSIFAP